MYCPEHLVFKAFSERVYLWMYWQDVPRTSIPLRIWMNPLRYELFIRAFGRVVKINAEGRWARTVPAALHKKIRIREWIYDVLVRRVVSEACLLPPWAVAVRWILFPLDSAYWTMGRARGYQWQNDTWLIDGVRYSGRALRAISDARGEIYRITRTGEVVTLERVRPGEQ